MFHTLLSTAINNVLRLDPVVADELERFNGYCIAIELLDPKKTISSTWYLVFTSGKVQVLNQTEQRIDCLIQGKLSDIIQLAKQGNSGKVEISGNTQLAADLQDLFMRLDIDWEEHLSRFIGDIPAHQVSNQLRSALIWGRYAYENSATNTGDYLQFEANLIAPSILVEQFCQDIDTLRDDSERLQARVQRLQAIQDKISSA